MKQSTIAKEAVFEGRGLHSGRTVRVSARPAGAGSGIVFRRKDLGGEVRLSAAALGAGDESFSRRSTVGAAVAGGVSFGTVEHLLAALWCLGIDNAVIEADGPEMPAMDGSALSFLEGLRKAGVAEQAPERKRVKIKEPIEVSDGDSRISISPGEGLSVSYYIDFDCPSIPAEEFRIALDPATFEKEIAPARTFCLRKEAEALLKAGYGAGADLSNTLVMDDDGPVSNTLRFANEPVRHKVLDLVGDLYLLGMPVEGAVAARKSGHRLNVALVKRIYQEYVP